MPVEIVLELTVGSQTIPILSIEYNILGPSDTEPTPTTGFTLLPTPIQLDSIKYWVEYRIV